MPGWNVTFRCIKGRGPNTCEYEGEVLVGGDTVGDAYREFLLWAKSRPDGRESIRMKRIEEVNQASTFALTASGEAGDKKGK